MNTTELITRPVRNWGEAVMRTCDYCSHHKMTVLNSDGSAICASCSDAEYATNLLNAVEIYQTRNAELVEALESAQRKIAELEARTVTVKLPEVRITVSESRRRNLNWRELGAYNEGAEVAVEKMVRALFAAGIKCEVKGE